jgi:hypothetical protein
MIEDFRRSDTASCYRCFVDAECPYALKPGTNDLNIVTNDGNGERDSSRVTAYRLPIRSTRVLIIPLPFGLRTTFGILVPSYRRSTN